MKKPVLCWIALFAWLGSSSLLGSAQAEGLKYNKVRIFIVGAEDMRSLHRAGLDFGHIRFRQDAFDAVLDEREMELLLQTGAPHEVLIDDMVADYQRRAALPAAKRAVLEQEIKAQFPVQGLELGSMGGFYTFDEVVAELDSMRLLYPHLISSRESIGTSVEGRPIWMVRISDHPDVDESEPEVLYTALHHAREPQGLMAVMYFMYYLLEHYDEDPEVGFIVDNRELYFVPVVNPDGYVYNQQVQPGGGNMWRKNRRDNGGSFGVDLNRNYGYQWGYNNLGSSTDPASSVYRGTGPFSEPETQALRALCRAHDFKLALNFHDFVDSYVLYPWGYTGNFQTPDSTTFFETATEMTRFTHHPHGATGQILYVANGNSDDWMYGEQTAKNKIYAMTPEIGAGFWPLQSKIFQFADQQLHANLVAARGQGVIDDSLLSTVITAAPEVPGVFSVRPNYPNPFNPATTIAYELSRNSQVRLMVYDILGRKVRTLVDERVQPGHYRAVWDGRDDGGTRMSSGVYVFRFRAGDYQKVRKMVLLR